MNHTSALFLKTKKMIVCYRIWKSMSERQGIFSRHSKTPFYYVTEDLQKIWVFCNCAFVVSWEGGCCMRGAACGMNRMPVVWMLGPRPNNRSRFIASLSRGWEFRGTPVSSLKKGQRSPSQQELSFPFADGGSGVFSFFFPHELTSREICILCKLVPSCGLDASEPGTTWMKQCFVVHIRRKVCLHVLLFRLGENNCLIVNNV